MVGRARAEHVAYEPRAGPEHGARELERIQRGGAAAAQGLRPDDLAGDRAGAQTARAGAVARRGAEDAPAAPGASRTDRPTPHCAPRHQVERRADPAVPPPRAGAETAAGSDLRRERFDGALLAPVDDLRPRDRAPRGPRSVRVLDTAHSDHAAASLSRPGPVS